MSRQSKSNEIGALRTLADVSRSRIYWDMGAEAGI